MIDNKNHLPNHLAIIMDGNGRWAEQKGKKRIFGHKNGIKAVQKVVEEAVELKIRYLTLYAFSTENWNRPREEIGVLMKLLVNSLKNEYETIPIHVDIGIVENDILNVRKFKAWRKEFYNASFITYFYNISIHNCYSLGIFSNTL